MHKLFKKKEKDSSKDVVDSKLVDKTYAYSDLTRVLKGKLIYFGWTF
jgi:hypothetical protein